MLLAELSNKVNSGTFRVAVNNNNNILVYVREDGVNMYGDNDDENMIFR